MGKPAVFFDRDGVVNRSPGSGYVLSWDEFEFMPGIVDALRLGKERGYLIFLVTSQRCVGKGLLSREELAGIHTRMQEELDREGAAFDGIYAFTGEPGTENLEKPKPGLVLAAAKEHGIDLARSVLIGDADRDIEMGRSAGVGTAIRVRGEKPVSVTADHEVGDTADLAPLLGLLLC